MDKLRNKKTYEKLHYLAWYVLSTNLLTGRGKKCSKVKQEQNGKNFLRIYHIPGTITSFQFQNNTRVILMFTHYDIHIWANSGSKSLNSKVVIKVTLYSPTDLHTHTGSLILTTWPGRYHSSIWKTKKLRSRKIKTFVTGHIALKQQGQKQNESRREPSSVPSSWPLFTTSTLHHSHGLISERAIYGEQTHGTQPDCDQAEGRTHVERLNPRACILTATIQSLAAYHLAF